AGRVVDGIGDRGGCTHDADLTDAFDTERVDRRVLLVDEDHVDGPYVGVHGDMIVREIVGHEAAEPVVGRGLLMQRHADATHHGAKDLAGRKLGIEDATCCHRADHARYAYDAKILIDLDFGEYGRVRTM